MVVLSDAAFSIDEAPRGGYVLCLRPKGSSCTNVSELLPVAWRSTKQRCITMSTTEAELVQLCISGS